MRLDASCPAVEALRVRDHCRSLGGRRQDRGQRVASPATLAGTFRPRHTQVVVGCLGIFCARMLSISQPMRETTSIETRKV